MENQYSNHSYKNQNIQNAKELRRNMTEQEKKLWFLYLRNYTIKFYRQRAVNNYVLDFYCAKARLAIELDGSQHYSDDGIDYDENRTRALQKYGIKVIRFTNPQLTYKFKEVCEVIDAEIKARLE